MPELTQRWGAGVLAGALTALALLSPAPAAPAHAAAAPGGSDKPAVTLVPDREPGAGARDRSYVVRSVRPGETFDDVLVATNLTDAPLPVVLNGVDAAINDNGQFAPAANGVRRDAGSWLALERTKLTLPASGSVRIPVHVTVPENATSGDHLAAFTIEKDTPTPAGAGIALQVRVAVRVYLTVDGAGQAAFAVTDLRFTGDADHPQLQATVAATGDRLVEPLGKLTISRGTLSDTVKLPVLGTVPARGERTFTIELRGTLDSGTYTADLGLRLLEGDATADRQARFTIPSLAPAPRHGSGIWLSPRLLVPALGALLAIAAVAWLLRRRRISTPAAARHG